MDATRTDKAHAASRSTRQDKRTAAAQARLADLSFSTFMREHNARIERLAARERGEGETAAYVNHFETEEGSA